MFYPFSFPKFQTCSLRNEFLELWCGERGVRAGGQGREGCHSAGIDLAPASRNGWSAKREFFSVSLKKKKKSNLWLCHPQGSLR